VDGVIATIRQELKRLGATEMDVGRTDEIRVKDRGDGNAQLEGAPVKSSDFHWYGKAAEIYERLASLPGGSGPEAIRSEFAL
jgi:hypothetical protein